jgi:hypothetical protein
MKFLVTIFKFYLPGLLFGCLSTRLFHTIHSALEIVETPQFLLGPLIFLLLGLAIGGLLYLTNIEANEDFLNGNASYPLQERRAFKMLTDRYKDPNDLRLVETSVSRYDSIVDRAKTDAFDIEIALFPCSFFLLIIIRQLTGNSALRFNGLQYRQYQGR